MPPTEPNTPTPVVAPSTAPPLPPATVSADQVANQVATDVKVDAPAVEADVKTLGGKLDAVLKETEAALHSDGSRELALVRTKLEEAKLWLDKLLQKKP